MLTRRQLLLTTPAAALAATRKTPPLRPNVVLVLTDNVGAWMLGCYGNQEIKTPNLDELARTGMRLQHGFVYAPDAAPSRGMLLSGRTSAQTGGGGVADLLTAQGYKCGEGVGFLEQQTADKPFFAVITPDAAVAQKQVDLYAATSFTTTGWDPAAKNAAQGKEMLGDIVASSRKAAAGVSALDDQVAALMKRIRERGLQDKTLVIFTSTCGNLLGRHGLWGAGRASDPVNMYEESIGVPMIWSWPGKIPAEATTIESVTSYDFLPTICEFAGATVPAGLKGRSYAAIVMRQPLPKKEPWRNVVFGQLGNTEMVRDSRFKLVLRNGGQGPNELYDLANDLRETKNVYDNAEFLTVRNALTQEIAGWRQRNAA